MQDAAAHAPPLRLVNTHAARGHQAVDFRTDGAGAAISHADARWVFAVRVAATLEGGRAAILRPERREQLVRIAHSLGLRTFDASVAIALVQDAARRGQPLDRSVESGLLMLAEPESGPLSKAGPALSLASAAMFALAMLALLVRWITAG